MALNGYDFIFKDHNEVIEDNKLIIAGWTPCGKANVLEEVEIISHKFPPTILTVPTTTAFAARIRLCA